VKRDVPKIFADGMGSDGTVGRHRNLNRATFFSAASWLSIPGRTADMLTVGGEGSFEQLNERGNAINANTRTFAIALLTSTFATATWAQELGRVHFQTSCTPQAQEKFDRALAMVHSFVYPDSVQAFTEAAAADPQCAIAYWGIAISHRPNPLILPLAAAVLKNGWEAVEKGKAIGAKTERERDCKVDQTTRGLAYEKAMEQLVQKYPDDQEAASFYALALNETALPSDKSYAKELKAGAILEKILATQPNHPGALHYLIHTYDYPPLAQRALEAANKYADVAPAAQHAQHMPSHTYSMLGLWQQSVESNGKSRMRAEEQAARLWPGAAHPSEPHHLDFAEYALLQMGKEQQARQLRDESNAIKKLGFDFLGSYTGPAAVPARFALERQAWNEAAGLEPRGSQFPQAEAITYFARAIGSARGGNPLAADQEVGKLKELRAALEKANQSYWAEQVEIQMLAASAWIAQAKGQKEEAVKFMRAAADLEDNSEKHIAMENRLYPMRELLGDLLLEQQQYAQALNEYEVSFQSTPNRLRGLYGAAKAAQGARQPEKAAIYFRKLAELTKDADADRLEIREAKAFLTRR
jgi:tetratricopeptide (TPR) repeat protein